MKAATHIAFAGLLGVVATGLGYQVGVSGSAALVAGSLLPDIDTTTSGLGRWIKPISSVIERRLGHRSLTHSLLGMLLLSFSFSWILYFSAWVYLWLLVGFFSHIVLDSHNVTGVPLLYPLRLEFVSIYDRGMRVKYGSSTEFSYLAAFTFASLILLPFSLDGFSPWFHRALGAPYGAVEDYLRWRDEAEVWVFIQGHNLLTDEDINGSYRAIDALDRDTLLVEDSAGRAYSAALTNANIQVRRIRAWKGESLISSTYRLDLSGRLVSDLIYSLPKGTKTLHINAALELNDEVTAVPAIGYFQRISVKGKSLLARSATMGDLATYSSLVIESGSAVIRAEYAPGSEVMADLSVISNLPQLKSHVLKIPHLPSLAGLVVDLGDSVIEGQLIARYVNDDELEISQQELEELGLQLAQLEAELPEETKLHETRLKGLRRESIRAKEELERLRYLVERNAEPKNSLLSATAHLEKADQAVMLEETTWTSKKSKLEEAIRQAKLKILAGERDKKKQLESQWVKSPVVGVISEIRVADIGINGLDLEIILLEQTSSDD